jgi:hypothetical protein
MRCLACALVNKYEVLAEPPKHARKDALSVHTSTVRGFRTFAFAAGHLGARMSVFSFEARVGLEWRLNQATFVAGFLISP